MPKKYTKARYSIGNVSKKDLSKIIRDFDKFSYKGYERRRPKHENTDSKGSTPSPFSRVFFLRLSIDIFKPQL